jgi:predicted HicB family RNase H-like nuclease
MFEKLIKKLEDLDIIKSKKDKIEESTPSKSEYTGLNIRITRTFHKIVKRQALEEDTSIADIVIKALTAYIDKKKD